MNKDSKLNALTVDGEHITFVVRLRSMRYLLYMAPEPNWQAPCGWAKNQRT